VTNTDTCTILGRANYLNSLLPCTQQQHKG